MPQVPKSVQVLASELTGYCPLGYALAVRLRYGRSLLSLVTYDTEWSNYYGQHNFVLCDPTVVWGLTHSGMARWNEVRFPDPFGVLPTAASYGLRFGATFSCGFASARTILGCGRSDREFDSGEMQAIAHILDRIHLATGEKLHLSDRQVAALRLFAEGYDYDEISAELGISRTALKGRLAGARKRLEARSNVDAVRIAAERSILNPNPFVGSLN